VKHFIVRPCQSTLKKLPFAVDAPRSATRVLAAVHARNMCVSSDAMLSNHCVRRGQHAGRFSAVVARRAGSNNTRGVRGPNMGPQRVL
jgi:hypothetical protein